MLNWETLGTGLGPMAIGVVVVLSFMSMVSLAIAAERYWTFRHAHVARVLSAGLTEWLRGRDGSQRLRVGAFLRQTRGLTHADRAGKGA